MTRKHANPRNTTCAPAGRPEGDRAEGSPSGESPDVDPSTGCTFGEVVPTRSTATSKVEAQVRDFLRDAGYEVPRNRAGVLCHHTDPKWSFLTLTPDVLLADLRLAVEVDPCDPSPSHRGSSHVGEEAKDRIRNDLLAAVGWTVIRLRLGAVEGSHIGDRDVVVESSAFTKAAQRALTHAIDDFKHGRPATIRVVKKGESPKPAQRRSHIVNIKLDPYSDDTYWFTWYPDLEQPENYSFRLAAAGRYLYRQGFLDQVDLDLVPPDDWKARLTSYLDGRSPADLRGTTKWPWGDLLLVPTDPSDPVAAAIVGASDHEKQTIDVIGFWFTVSGDQIGAFSDDSLDRSDGSSLATMHPAAVEAGYRFAAVTLNQGYRGPYQRVVVTRAPRG
ncbi:hypothetical protein QWY28_00010 [Nocardioides sp. SOB77]|uniref:Uncharacterized protein n=1 Tax=Nocardioides oceani TaxID=3058369 RepID=A0ABT8FA90_9ACTN|nr:hypothetical protein [Nocardioides oceani]MDN4171317.1 hypothetical protein [Nocardioides oceani]